MLYQPTPQIQLVGQPGAVVSELDFDDLQLDENGVPRNYSRVQRGAKTTGYSVRPGQGTASGRAPVPGIVAVDPRKIPYGTRMYIRSADGQFVYGCAIAGETGTAMSMLAQTSTRLSVKRSCNLDDRSVCIGLPSCCTANL